MAVVEYRRVSTSGQRLDRQAVAGDVDRVFDEAASGKNSKDRPQLAAALAYVREGDTFRVHSGDRLARSLADLLRTTNELVERGVRVEFVKEGLTFDPAADADPYARCMLSMLGAFSELERSLILARQAEGIALAKERGAYRGRQPALQPDEVRAARQRRADGVTLTRLMKDYGVSKATMQHALNGTGVYATVA
jgi:DNA invertase Pin-like site-specific DNA recombinase